RAAEGPRPAGLWWTGLGLRRGPVDDPSRGRRGRAGRRAGGGAVRSVQLQGRGGFLQPAAVGHAPRVRRSPGEEVMKVIDVSLTIGPDLLVWPGDPPVAVTPRSQIAKGDPANVSEVRMGTHTGT